MNGGRGKFRDLSGVKIGRWTVISRAPNHIFPSGRSGTMWNCVCECGAKASVNACSLKSGDSKSCGCLQSELAVAQNTTHGHYVNGDGSPTMKSYEAMIQRTTNPNSTAWYKYGARGIKTCARWQAGFTNFLADMGVRPSGLTLERKDNSGDYTPENCRWATVKEQGRNKRNNRMLVIRGETLCVSEWAERRPGLDSRRIWAKLKRGCSHEEAVFGQY